MIYSLDHFMERVAEGVDKESYKEEEEGSFVYDVLEGFRISCRCNR